MAKKLSDYVVSPLIQKLFIGLGVAGYGMQLATTVPIFLIVYGGDWQLSQFTYFVAESILLPLILFGLAYAAGSKKMTQLQRTFRAMFLAVLGLAVQVIATQLIQIVMESALVHTGAYMDVYVWYQAVTSLVVLTAYALVVRRVWGVKPAKNAVELRLQRLFVATVGIAFAVMLAITLYRVLAQYPSNPNLSGFFAGAIQSLGLPAVMFGLAYAAGSQKVSQLGRVFGGMLLSVTGMMLFTVLSSLSGYISSSFLQQGSYSSWLSYELTIVAFALVLYCVLLWVIRRQQR